MTRFPYITALLIAGLVAAILGAYVAFMVLEAKGRDLIALFSDPFIQARTGTIENVDGQGGKLVYSFKNFDTSTQMEVSVTSMTRITERDPLIRGSVIVGFLPPSPLSLSDLHPGDIIHIGIMVDGATGALDAVSITRSAPATIFPSNN